METKREIRIVSKENCKFCDKAKDFLNNLDLPFATVLLDPNEEDYSILRDYYFNKYNVKSFPIITINGKLIGGYTDLVKSYDTLLLHSACGDIGIHLDIDANF